MDYFFLILAALIVLGFYWIADRKNIKWHMAAMFLFCTCVAFWIIMPK